MEYTYEIGVFLTIVCGSVHLATQDQLLRNTHGFIVLSKLSMLEPVGQVFFNFVNFSFLFLSTLNEYFLPSKLSKLTEEPSHNV